jgi:hypothetical protein
VEAQLDLLALLRELQEQTRVAQNMGAIYKQETARRWMSMLY